MNISVIGSGSWGTAIAIMLAQNGHSVRLWSFSQSECEGLKAHGENKLFLPGFAIPQSVEYTTDIYTCANANLIVCALPSFAVRATMGQLSSHIKPAQVVVNISKGLETESLLTLSAVLRDTLPTADIAVMTGPSHAEEVAQKAPTTNVVAAANPKTANFIQDIFMNPYFRVYTHDDILGVELGGSLKNVIALCAGISDGLGFGDNTKAALMTRGISEITRLGIAMGAKAETFAGLSGIGDLIVTCTSMHSRNRRAGILIGQGKTASEACDEIKMVVEGINTCRAAKYLADKYNVEMPIINQAYAVLFENKPAKEATLSLMNRDKRHESEKGFLASLK
ncbi:MAG: NAD(P)H-dependent glycerol-3-phosphate dehydrogenase [Defluviitaleaceae bacterium]|nr:NAD(P)H-dependent glycerol-3-phosphate dehydrogenase [Defluviitaleaceae bacterium]